MAWRGFAAFAGGGARPRGGLGFEEGIHSGVLFGDAGVDPGQDAVDVLEDEFEGGLAGYVRLGGCGEVLGRQGGDGGLGFG